MRILTTTQPPSKDKDSSKELELGVEEGGLHSAEALLLARYFTFSQVCFHPIRRIYDIHLQEFLSEWLSEREGLFPIELDDFLKITDNEVMSAIREAASDSSKKGHIHADRIISRKHFKELNLPTDEKITKLEALESVYKAAKEHFGKEYVYKDYYSPPGSSFDFPVLARDNRIKSANSISQIIKHLPIASTEYVFIHPDKRESGLKWLKEEKENIIKRCEEE